MHFLNPFIQFWVLISFQLSTLAQHRATHLNRRPFFCDICNKSFNRVSTLISHRKIHSNDKRHICHICNKGFHQKGNLRNHIYTHTNERPYKCEICEKGFNQKSNLVCHKVCLHIVVYSNSFYFRLKIVSTLSFFGVYLPVCATMYIQTIYN
ncbi:hypothetical protein AAG570_003722 [Ranatra chinensis]|uniref:C2H2-type domain-containing protein n=1 Tax=Ranatra chinensis TaxID=642074 RepID=A0ABD0YIV8_9HEMI